MGEQETKQKPPKPLTPRQHLSLKRKRNSLYSLQQLVTHARRAERGPPAKPLPPIIIQTGTSEARGKGRNFAARPRRPGAALPSPPPRVPPGRAGRQRGGGAPPGTNSRRRERRAGGRTSERRGRRPPPAGPARGGRAALPPRESLPAAATVPPPPPAAALPGGVCRCVCVCVCAHTPPPRHPRRPPVTAGVPHRRPPTGEG